MKSIIFPKNRFFDKLVNFYRFLKIHKRFPKKNKNGFNDLMFFIKSSEEILLPERQFVSDKELVKIFIKAKVGDDYNVPTKAILRNEYEIDLYKFEYGDVVKPTHSCGFVDFINNSNNIDKKKYKKWLHHNYYNLSREANYKNLKPKIIVEPLVFGAKKTDDLKVFCKHGEVKFIQVDFDRHSNHTRKLYSKDWNDLQCSLGYPLSSKHKEKPIYLHKMLEIASHLSNDFSFLRVDMYYCEKSGRFLVGELTNVHGGSNEKFMSCEQENKINILFN